MQGLLTAGLHKGEQPVDSCKYVATGLLGFMCILCGLCRVQGSCMKQTKQNLKGRSRDHCDCQQALLALLYCPNCSIKVKSI